MTERLRVLLTKRQMAVGLLGALAMVLVLTTLYTLIQTNTVVALIREDQQSSVERNKITAANTEQIKRIAEQIESCTNPEGECSKRSQERTSKAVASVNDVIIATAACDNGTETLPEIRACVKTLLKSE